MSRLVSRVLIRRFCTRPFPLFVFFNPEASAEALTNSRGPAVATVAPCTLGFVPSLSGGGGGPPGSGSVRQVKVKAEQGPCSSNVGGGEVAVPTYWKPKRENDSGDSVFSPPQVTPQAEPTH